MRTDAAVNAARALKAQGAVRADITVDPRLPLNAARHLNAFPVADFTHAARNLCSFIFAPMIGRSDVQDFSNAVGRYYDLEVPDLYTLSNVGSLFADARQDGGYLGLALYTALHGKSYDRKPYTHLLYPDMTPNARRVLSTKLGGKCMGVDDETSVYGAGIDLQSMRERIGLLIDAGNRQPAARIQ